jgi:hypothetical protein
MTKTIKLFNPTPSWMGDLSVEPTDSTPVRESQLQSQVEPIGSKLAGMVVGFIDNAKPNFRFLVEDLAQVLRSQYQVAQVHVQQKRAASLAAPNDMLDQMLQTCDLVIAGSGD